MEPRHFLFFTPGAHPTYIPLGLASLAGYAQRETPAVSLEVVDLNIRFWQQVLSRNAVAGLGREFFRGRLGDFYSEKLYGQYKGELDQHYRFLNELEHDVKKFMQNGAVAPSVAGLDVLLEPFGLEAGPSVRVAFSVMYPGQLVFALYLAQRVRELRPDAEIVLGGAAMSAVDIGELRSAANWIDAVFEGEGEIPFVAWLTRQATNSRTFLAMESLPDPDFSFAPLGDYLLPETVLPVVFSRGCQWKRCRFCCHNASFRGYRASTWEAFAQRLGRLQLRYGARFFYLADQYVSADDLRGISRAILDIGLDVRFHVMGRPGSEYSPEILELANKAGCRWISWGVESFSAHLLEICDKGTTPAEIARVLEQSSQAGISNLAMMIFGLPGSSEACLQETLDWATRLNPSVDAFTSSQFQLFGGTPFFRNRSRYGLEAVEREVLLHLGGEPVHSRRYAYRVSEGEMALAREVDVWERWKLFTRSGTSFYETLLCEHYLLHCSRARDSRQTPLTPHFPPRVAA